MRDVTIIISNEYKVKSEEVNGIKVNSYYAKHNKGDYHQGELSLQGTVDAILAFTKAYANYPYEEIDIVESGYEYEGMEAPGLVRISNVYSLGYFGESASKEEVKEGENRMLGSVAHEVAHQWFYGVIGNNQYSEAWLDESFAAFSEQVYWRYIGKNEEDIEKEMNEFLTKIPKNKNVAIDISQAHNIK